MFRALIPAAASAALFCSVASAGELWVSIDTVTRYQMPDGVGQVLLTNPGVADVEVASATELMFFGRIPGHTDVVFQGADGKRISQMRVRVGNERGGLVTLYNGAERYSFSCTHRCEQTMVVGDGRLGDAQRLVGQSQTKLAAGSFETELSGEAFEVAPAAPAPTNGASPGQPGS